MQVRMNDHIPRRSGSQNRNIIVHRTKAPPESAHTVTTIVQAITRYSSNFHAFSLISRACSSRYLPVANGQLQDFYTRLKPHYLLYTSAAGHTLCNSTTQRGHHNPRRKHRRQCARPFYSRVSVGPDEHQEAANSLTRAACLPWLRRRRLSQSA
jgi:hypothetical protein